MVQAIVPFLSSRAYAFAVMLATYFTGLVLGSFLYARFADRTRNPWLIFGLLVTGAGALLAYPDLKRRVCVELLPPVVRAVPLFKGNMDIARDPRVELRVRDGRHELLATTERWESMIKRLVPEMRNNPYFRWFVTDKR